MHNPNSPYMSSKETPPLSSNGNLFIDDTKQHILNASFYKTFEIEKMANQEEQMQKIRFLYDENIEECLQLDPHKFDQDKEKGWRRFCETPDNLLDFAKSEGRLTENFKKSITIIELYLASHKFGNEYKDKMEKWGIEFHLGQLYAFIGDYTKALFYITKLQNEGSEKHGKEYIASTIAFLQRDKERLQYIYENSPNAHILDKPFIEYLYKYFNMTYFEAYSGGITFAEIPNFLTK